MYVDINLKLENIGLIAYLNIEILRLSFKRDNVWVFLGLINLYSNIDPISENLDNENKI